MKIMVSACLLGENCKYNGGNNYSEKLNAFLEGHEVIPVCPEVEGGLSIPRLPAEIVDGIVRSSDGTSVDYEFRHGSELVVKRALEEGVDLAVLQSRSPSCGVKQIYDGTFTGNKITGKGVFAQQLDRNGIKTADIADIPDISQRIPEFKGGVKAKYLYNVGCGTEQDTDGPTSSDSYARLITGVTDAEYRSYIDSLSTGGYETVFTNRIEKNLYTQLKKDDNLLYVYYTEKTGEIRIISDVCSVSVPEFEKEDSIIADTGKAEAAVRPLVVQYGLYYDPKNECTETTVNCGMLYIVRLTDNSLYLYDGGDLLQCTDRMLEGLMEFLHRITDTVKGEKIRVSAWHFSHCHDDHIAGAAKIMNRCHEELQIDRFIFNFCASYVREPDTQAEMLKKVIAKYYPEAKYLKLHTGQRFDLKGVTFEVLYTHEDAINAESGKSFDVSDYNSSSTVVLMKAEGCKVMFLGDAGEFTAAKLTDIYSKETLKSNLVQVAHHCFNRHTGLYAAIDAGYAMAPNSYYGCHTVENLSKLGDVLEHLDTPECISYADRTTGIELSDGRLNKVFEEALIGGEYDNSGY